MTMEMLRSARIFHEAMILFVPLASVFITTVSGIVSMFFAFVAMRAKVRAWVALQNTADLNLRMKVRLLEERRLLVRSEIDEVRTMVESETFPLSQDDKRILEQGLTQPSEAGAARFARELLRGKV